MRLHKVWVNDGRLIWAAVFGVLIVLLAVSGALWGLMFLMICLIGLIIAMTSK